MVCDSTALQKQHKRRALSITHPNSSESSESLTLPRLFSHFFPPSQDIRGILHMQPHLWPPHSLKFKTQQQHSNETNLPLVRPSSSFTPSEIFFFSPNIFPVDKIRLHSDTAPWPPPTTATLQFPRHPVWVSARGRTVTGGQIALHQSGLVADGQEAGNRSGFWRRRGA